MSQVRRATSVLLALSVLAGLCAAGVALFAWLAAGRVARPPWYEHRTVAEGLRPAEGPADPAALGLEFEDVEIAAADGSALRGWLVPGPEKARAAVVGVHGGGGDRRSYLGLAPDLRAAGYTVLLFDCREQGVSDGTGRGPGLGVRESEDVRSAVAWLAERRGRGPIAVLGRSQGASAAILAAASEPRIAAVVAESGATSLTDLLAAQPMLGRLPRGLVRLVARVTLFRVGAPWAVIEQLGPSPIDLVDRLAPRPLLLIHGSADDTVPVDHAKRLFARAGEGKELWIVEGAGHRALANAAPTEYRERVLAFLARSLR